MRTLKKTLCLVLCLAMMVGLCAIGASAIKYDDYKDKENIKYEKAVTLLTALGVLEGDEKGFRPQDELNRAEGAAILTRLLQKEIDKTAVSSFTDMAGYGWAQPYVKFCEDYGIIAGYGNGKFGPGDKLTTSQFAKMLICALGYNAEKQGLVGNAWEINTTMKVTGLALADGLDVYAPGKNIQREQAAQLAYNTLFQPMVNDEGKSLELSWIGAFLGGEFLEGLNIGNMVVTVKDGTPVPNNAYDYNINAGDNVLQFVEACFPWLKVKTEDDDFAIPTNYWFKGKSAVDKTYRDEKLLCTTIAVPVLAIYDEGIANVTGKQVYDDAGFTNVGEIAIYENGELLGSSLEDYEAYGLKKTSGSAIWVWEVSKNDKNVYPFGNKGFGYGGAQAYLLDTEADGADARLAVKYPYLAKVVGVIPGEDRTLTLSVYNDSYAPVNASVSTYETDKFEKDDYILVYPQGEMIANEGASDLEILEAKLPDAKEGILSKVNLDKTVNGIAVALTVSGEKYDVGSDWLANLGPEKQVVGCAKEYYTVGDTVTVYTSFGYVLGFVPASVSYSNWVFAIGPGHKIESPFGGWTWSYGYVDQKAVATETRIRSAAAEAEDVAKEYWTLVTPGDPISSFVAPDKAPAANKTAVIEDLDVLKHDKPDLGMGKIGENEYKITADSRTAFVFRTDNGFVAVTGIHNIDDYSKDGWKGDNAAVKAWALIPYASEDEVSHAVAVYVDLRGCKSDAPAKEKEAPIFILCDYPSTKQIDGQTKPVYAYDALIPGETKPGEILAKDPLDQAPSEFDGAGLYIPTYSADRKYVIKVEKIETGGKYVEINVTDKVTKVENHTINFENLDATYAFTTDASKLQVFVYDEGKDKLTPNVSVEALTTLPYGKLCAVATAKDQIIETIYFIYDSTAPNKYEPVV